MLFENIFNLFCLNFCLALCVTNLRCFCHISGSAFRHVEHDVDIPIIIIIKIINDKAISLDNTENNGKTDDTDIEDDNKYKAD